MLVTIPRWRQLLYNFAAIRRETAVTAGNSPPPPLSYPCRMIESHVIAAYERFTELARRYCNAIEDETLKGREALEAFRILLSDLYASAAVLPDVQPGDPSDRFISDATFTRLCRRLGARLPVDTYWSPHRLCTAHPEEAVAGSLTDDLADIWRDLKSGLMGLVSAGYSTRAYIWWDWRFQMEIHWGRHATDALRVMHEALQDIA